MVFDSVPHKSAPAVNGDTDSATDRLGSTAYYLTRAEWDAGYSQGYNAGLDDERNRTLSLLASSLNRIRANKGRGWESELGRLAQEIEYGHQQIPGTT